MVEALDEGVVSSKYNLQKRRIRPRAPAMHGGKRQIVYFRHKCLISRAGGTVRISMSDFCFHRLFFFKKRSVFPLENFLPLLNKSFFDV